MSKLDGRIAIVSGGASGIGSECARWLAREGAFVMVADLDAPAAEGVAEEIRTAGGAAAGYALDIADESQIREFMEKIVSDHGPIRVLHNNAVDSSVATLGRDGAVASMDIDIWDRTFAVNTRGTMLMVKHALPSMAGAGGGSIINTSSGAAVVADVLRPAYGASKSALHAFTRSVATQYGKLGIRCNAVCPGLILTPALRRSLPDSVIDMVERQTLTPRLGIPADIAALVTLLATDDSAFITGQVINVDGGNTVHFGHVAEIYDDFLRDTNGAGVGMPKIIPAETRSSQD